MTDKYLHLHNEEKICIDSGRLLEEIQVDTFALRRENTDHPDRLHLYTRATSAHENEVARQMRPYVLTSTCTRMGVLAAGRCMVSM